MGNGINKVIVVGHLGQDPNSRFSGSGKAITTINVGTNEQWKDGNGMRQERTEWHRVVMFDRLAEIAGEYLKKGSQVYVEGSLHTRKWQDQQGNDRYTTEIKAKEMQMLGGRAGATNAQGDPRAHQVAAPPPQTAPQNDDSDEKIPF